MDSMTLIAVASIVTAGLTTGFGTHGTGARRRARGRDRAEALAQQPDASATITRTLFVGLAMIESTAIYCFVVSMILIFANPFWNHVIAQAAGKVDHAHRLVHRRRAGDQLSHPGVVDEALSLQAHPRRHRRAGEADRRGTRGRRREKGRGPKERDEFQHKNEEFDEQRAALLSKRRTRRRPSASGSSTRRGRPPTP
jgi:F-type H+-transporting ATPase subunit c